MADARLLVETPDPLETTVVAILAEKLLELSEIVR